MDKTKGKERRIGKIILVIIAISIIMAFSLYISSSEVRDWVDIHILKKEIMEDDLESIDLNSSDKNYIHAYWKYVVVLNNNVMNSYISSSYKAFEQDVTITTPIFASQGKYLSVAENGGAKIYLISGENILWQKDIDGEIFRIDVNKNGYVAVVAKGKNYQNIVYTIDKEGRELFKMYISSTTVVKAKLSQDNSKLAIAEVDTTGTIVKTKVKTVDVNKAQTDPNNSITNVYESEGNNTIVDIEYQDKNKLVCMYDDRISILDNGNEDRIIDLSQGSIAGDINLKNSVVEAKEEASDMFSTDTKIFIKNINNKNEHTYTVKNTLKKLYTRNNIIAANMGNEAYFINQNGRLVKKYISKQEIQDIVIGDSIVGIIYKNKVELFSY